MKLKVTAKHGIVEVGGNVVNPDGTVDVPDDVAAALLAERPEDFVMVSKGSK